MKFLMIMFLFLIGCTDSGFNPVQPNTGQDFATSSLQQLSSSSYQYPIVSSFLQQSSSSYVNPTVVPGYNFKLVDTYRNGSYLNFVFEATQEFDYYFNVRYRITGCTENEEGSFTFYTLDKNEAETKKVYAYHYDKNSPCNFEIVGITCESSSYTSNCSSFVPYRAN